MLTRTVPRDTLLFSDVDGTLIDPQGCPPRQWARIRELLGDALIVLTSSRTLPQLLEVQETLGIHGPVIAENGSVIAFPEGWPGTPAHARADGPGGWRTVRIGSTAPMLRAVVLGLASSLLLHAEVVSHGDATSPVAAPSLGLLLLEQGTQRTHSVLIQVLAPRERVALFLRAARRAQLEVNDGGEWFVVQHGASKGMAARRLRGWLDGHLRPGYPVVAAGDAANDRSLLEAADIRLVMRGSNGDVHPGLAFLDRARVARTAGVDGWEDLLPYLHLALSHAGGMADA